MIHSLVPDLLGRQLLSIGIGLGLYFIFRQIDYRRYQKHYLTIYFISLFLLITTLVFGKITRGSVRWLQIGQLTFQTSEFVKPWLILVFSAYFSQIKTITLKLFIKSLLLLILPVLLIFYQPNLGSCLIIILIWLAMIFVYGLKYKYLVLGLLAVITLLPISWRFLLRDYQKERINTFVNPKLDPLGSGYNLIQSTVAVGSGKLFGRGLGLGSQSQLKFLPERHTDFIFASLSEELGFVGSFLVIFLSFLLLWRLLLVAQQANELFGYLIGTGVLAMIFSQFTVNLGMNLGLLPVTGITLPFISYGGNSIVSLMISLGITDSIYILRKKASLDIIGVR